MEYRRLGRTGIKVSAISFGGLPTTFMPKEEVIPLIHTAIDMGINYFDLDEGPAQFNDKNAYIDSASKMGEVLKERRDEVYVGVKTMKKKKSEVLEDIDKALNLIFKGSSREVIDIFHLAFVDYEESLNEIMDSNGGIAALEEAKKQGLIDYTLVAGHNYPILIDAIKTGAFDVVEFPFNIIEYEVEEKLLPIAQKYDIGTVVMKPFGGGQFGEVAEAQMKWLYSKPVSCIIPGTKTIEELKKNIAVAESNIPLSDEENNKLLEFRERMGNRYCHRCGYCLPCPQGLRIFGLLDILNAGVLSYEKKKIAYLQAIEKGTLKPASECVACRECESRCPYDLPIADMMKEMVDKFGI
ncbi:MAG: hypothetical protein D6734_02085 [Candidatus Schekmanbacteria bacterium]|nr:MAG: hypothetical protein D6734_02085 [Candidatus Schekmanbacteria bacterium]